MSNANSENQQPYTYALEFPLQKKKKKKKGITTLQKEEEEEKKRYNINSPVNGEKETKRKIDTPSQISPGEGTFSVDLVIDYQS